jgi:thioredoxin 1
MEYTFTTANFEAEVLNSELPVLVDFYADWCGPCKMMAPIVEKIAEDYEGRLKVGKCNIDENMPLVQKYRVASIPTFVIFQGGQPAASYLGAMSADDLCDKIDANI